MPGKFSRHTDDLYFYSPNTKHCEKSIYKNIQTAFAGFITYSNSKCAKATQNTNHQRSRAKNHKN